ncbi:MAG: phosphate ABC transporter permease subunit PstC [Burkholderiales bacterium]|nr:phosphate ABC transporter permease subunit PstC [Burkholderiales bacterium]
MVAVYLLLTAALVLAAMAMGSRRASGLMTAGGPRLHSLPSYHGFQAAIAVFVVMLAILAVGVVIERQVTTAATLSAFSAEVAADPLRRGAALREAARLADGSFTGEPSPELRAAAGSLSTARAVSGWLMIAVGLAGGAAALLLSLRTVSRDYRARNRVERFVTVALMVAAGVAVLTTIGIVFSVVFETYRFFFDPALKGRPSVTEFLFGTQWSPQTAMRADQGQSGGAFGIVPLVAGTLLITTIAMLVAGPVGLFAAIYMSEYATPRFRAFAKPILEILAGIPTVVLGFFAALTVAPFIRGFGESLGLSVASESALAAGLVMGMMIIPFVSSLSDDVINAVPQSLRDGSYALGATRSETIKKVVLTAALPGIVSAFMLAISRAVGETMIVVMAAGLAANLTLNPLEAVTTFTVQIKTILVGDQEFDSAKTLAAFALGFVLFFFTLTLNVIALRIVKKYREQYD